jgi:hypothetical protein
LILAKHPANLANDSGLLVAVSRGHGFGEQMRVPTMPLGSLGNDECFAEGFVTSFGRPDGRHWCSLWTLPREQV